MGKIVILTTLFCIYSAAHAVSYRQAKPYDVDTICNLYDKFTPDDYTKLVVYPPEIRHHKILEAINKNKLFVACNDAKDGEKIVGFVKLFVIENMQESRDILAEELALTAEPYANGECTVDSVALLDYAQPLVFSDFGLGNYIRHVLASGTDECLYLYYGGAYTTPAYRNSCVNSQLIGFALNNIFDSHKLGDTFKFIAMAYGQVEANQHKQGMVRLFALKLIRNLGLDHINIFHFCCRALKPNFTFNNLKHDLEVSSYEPGFGNMAVIKLVGGDL